MSINYQQVFDQVRQMVRGQQEAQQELAERQQAAAEALRGFAFTAAQMEDRLDQARVSDTGLRCAQPTKEPITAMIPPPARLQGIVLIAADGSQILPDRHGPARYGLINTGAIVIRLGSGEAPKTVVESSLLSSEQLVAANGMPISDAMLGLMRDTEERITLLGLVEEASQPGNCVISLSDGPLELWGRREGPEALLFEQNLRKYLAVLSQIRDLGGIVAGYIDRPGANPVARMLELSIAGEQDLASFGKFHPLEGASDQWLFGKGGNLLLPAHRSALFRLRSKAEEDYSGSFEIHFFYLNVSDDPRDPQIARVEVPGWVAGDPNALGQVHACVMEQCGLLGARPFPYILHRAHEIAVVSHEEKKQIDEIFQMESLNQSQGYGTTSNKQTAKDAIGRTRYG